MEICGSAEVCQTPPGRMRARNWWGVAPGDKLEVFDTDRGKIAILICYDIEFPELARLLTLAGAEILLVPFTTDERKAYLRVRYSAHARAVEYLFVGGAAPKSNKTSSNKTLTEAQLRRRKR